MAMMETGSYYKTYGLVASKHSNFYNKLLALVQGCYIVIHDKANGTVLGVGEGNGSGNRSGRCRQEVIGNTSEGRVYNAWERAAGDG